MNVVTSLGLVINAPEFFQNPEFVAWLNNGNPKFTWHKVGTEPHEWSDVIVLVDPSLNGEGTDSDMPEAIWNEIVTQCVAHFGPGQSKSHIQVRLTNV